MIAYRLLPNKVPHLIGGGKLINRFLGLAQDAGPMASQLWVASTVRGELDGEAGLSRLEDGRTFLSLLSSDPSGLLGAEHAKRFGAGTGFLLKLLNPDQRLLVQAHPDARRAKRYFAKPCGKDEAWHVLDTDGETFIWAGFRQGVTREAFRALIARGDSDALLACLHRFAVRSGDTVMIRAGTPHALGAGSLVAEIQEPLDLTLRAERIRPDGTELSEDALHGGAGMDALIDCFDFTTAGEQATRERLFVRPESRNGETVWIGPSTTDRFGLRQISVLDSRERKNTAFVTVLVLQGCGTLEAEGQSLPLRKGDELFIPHTTARYAYHTLGGLEVLECDPPRGRETDDADL